MKVKACIAFLALVAVAMAQTKKKYVPPPPPTREEYAANIKKMKAKMWEDWYKCANETLLEVENILEILPRKRAQVKLLEGAQYWGKVFEHSQMIAEDAEQFRNDCSTKYPNVIGNTMPNITETEWFKEDLKTPAVKRKEAIWRKKTGMSMRKQIKIALAQTKYPSNCTNYTTPDKFNIGPVGFMTHQGITYMKLALSKIPRAAKSCHKMPGHWSTMDRSRPYVGYCWDIPGRWLNECKSRHGLNKANITGPYKWNGAESLNPSLFKAAVTIVSSLMFGFT